MTDYRIYNFPYIKENLPDIIHHLEIAHAAFERMFPNLDSTWAYNKYNIFSLTGPSSHFYKIFQEIRKIARANCGDEHELWMQSWINYMSYEEIDRLDWHGHAFDYHGYVCIDPKKTYTVFKEYQIENKIGQIYFGPGYRHHKVQAIEPYEGKRITLGFDIVCDIQKSKFVKTIQMPWLDLSLIPLS